MVGRSFLVELGGGVGGARKLKIRYYTFYCTVATSLNIVIAT